MPPPPPFGNNFPLGGPRTQVGSGTGFGQPQANVRGFGGGVAETSLLFASTVSGIAGQRMIMSDDGGDTWQFVAALPSNPITGQLAFDSIRQRLCSVAGPAGSIVANNAFFSDDYGASWTQSNKPSGARLGGTVFVPSAGGGAGEIWGVRFGVAGIERSADGGATWTANAGPADSTGKATDALDDKGNAYFTVTSGFAVRSPNGIAEFLAIGVNGPVRDVEYCAGFGVSGLVLGSADTTIQTSPDGGFGTAFTTRSAIAAGSPTFAYSLSRNECVCISSNDQRNSTDGINWADPGLHPANFFAADALYSEIWGRYIFVGRTAANASAVHTSEDGINWTSRYAPLTNAGPISYIVEAVL